LRQFPISVSPAFLRLRGSHCDGVNGSFGFLADLAHHPHGGLWEVARGRFAAEHDGVGAVAHRVEDVAALRPGRDRVGDHGLHHLRRHNHGKQAVLFGSCHKKLLRKGNSGVAQLDAQIAARHHEAAAQGHDFVDVVQGLGFLDFGAQVGALFLGHLEAVHDVDELLHVAGFLSERHADVVDRWVERQKVFGVLDVLRSHTRKQGG